MVGYVESKDALLTRLRRVEGQVRGLQRLVESDTYCIDVLTHVAAAPKSSRAAALELRTAPPTHRAARPPVPSSHAPHRPPSGAVCISLTPEPASGAPRN